MSIINILAIETSCDETSAAVVSDGKNVLSNIVSSQIDIHALYGGVVPEIASRKHIENITLIVEKAITESNITFKDIDAVAVTYGPGLVGALLVGINAAKGYSFCLNKPLIGINHIEGHIASVLIENNNLKPPFVALVASGGHTNIILVKDFGDYDVLGKTRDDAAGEAFDKIARALNLPYPGGPEIDKISKTGFNNKIIFPRSYIDKESYDFSFSGLKSSVLNYINQQKMKNLKINISDVAASFQEAVVEVLVSKTIMAAKNNNINKIAVVGGVSANSRLRKVITDECLNNNINIYIPHLKFTSDNAAMIGIAAYQKYVRKEFSDFSLNANPNLKI